MTTQATHTPGPWKSVKGARPTRPDIVADCGLICSLEYGPDEGEANAHLIKAAPDLLDAARLANEELCALGVGSSGSPALRALWWAIARAEGKEP
jgi:hypothetical protein